ncbi:MAG: hypothetical protein EBY65_07855, partial [Acidimicrobiia bacterium]|nr:hypothetical protein [Acidimicrobiia bacterium]
GTAIAAVTSEGRAFIFHAGEAADAGGRTRGNAAAQQLGLNKGEDALALVGAGEEHLVLVTAQGVAKQVTADEVLETKSGKPVIGLKDGDRVVAAFRAPAGVDVIAVASDGQALRMPLDSISVQGRGAGGVAGMKLKAGAEVVGAGPVIGDGVVLTVTSDSAAKATPYEEFESKGRGGQGVRVAKLGAAEVAMPIISSTATTLAAFVPLAPIRCRSTSRPRSEISCPPRPNVRSWSLAPVAGDP